VKTFSVSSDIIPIGEFKSSIAKWIKNVQSTGHPLVITQNGKPAGVLLSPSEYDELVHRNRFLDSVGRGLADSDAGVVYTKDEVEAELSRRRSLQRRK
jgi:prevent-host-death family protein